MSLISSQLVIFFRSNITQIDLRAPCSGCRADSRGADFVGGILNCLQMFPKHEHRAEFII